MNNGTRGTVTATMSAETQSAPSITATMATGIDTASTNWGR